MTNDGIVVGTTAASDAQRFVAAAQQFDRTSNRLSTAAAALTDQRTWSGASADQFRTEHRALRSHLETIGAALERMATGAKTVIDRIDATDRAKSAELAADRASTVISWAAIPWTVDGPVFDRKILTPLENINKELRESVTGLSAKDHDLGASLAALDHSDPLRNDRLTEPMMADFRGAKMANSRELAANLRELRAILPGLRSVRLVSRLGGSLGVVSDVGSIVFPNDHGTVGRIDQGAAAVNGVTTTLGMLNTLDGVPVVGEVVLGVDLATGAYLLGDFLYDNVPVVHNVSDDVGRSTASTVKGMLNNIKSGLLSLAHPPGI